MKIETTKMRIVQYLESKDIGLKDFYLKTGLKRGLLDSDKLYQSITDKNLATIIAVFDDVDLHWLLTGTGPMLKSESPPPMGDQGSTEIIALYKECLDMNRELIRENTLLKERINRKDTFRPAIDVITSGHQALPEVPEMPSPPGSGNGLKKDAESASKKRS